MVGSASIGFQWIVQLLRLRKGELVGYDGYRHRRDPKVHVVVTAESLPLSIVIGSGDEHDGVRLIEVFDGIMVTRYWKTDEQT